MNKVTVRLSKQDYDAIVLSGVALPKHTGTTIRSENGDTLFKLKTTGQNKQAEHCVEVVVDQEKIAELSSEPDQTVTFPVQVSEYDELEIGLTQNYKDLINSKE